MQNGIWKLVINTHLLLQAQNKQNHSSWLPAPRSMALLVLHGLLTHLEIGQLPLGRIPPPTRSRSLCLTWMAALPTNTHSLQWNTVWVVQLISLKILFLQSMIILKTQLPWIPYTHLRPPAMIQTYLMMELCHHLRRRCDAFAILF